VTLPAGVVAVLLAPAGPAEGAVPAALAVTTARAVLGGAAAAVGAAALARGVLGAPFARAVRAAGALALSLALLGAVVGFLPRPGQEPDGPPPAPAARARQRGQAPAPRPAARAAADARARAAQTAALRWLIAQQAADGHWAFPTAPGNDVAATAVAVLPLLRAGEGPPAAALFSPYARPAERGLAYLAGVQQADGGFPGILYNQALATLALCEGYRLTADPRLRGHAQRALDYIAWAQHVAGGWRYAPGQRGDTSVTTWQVLALDAGRSADLRVPPQALARASAFLDSVASEGGSAYGYIQPGQGTPTLRAAGLLCRLRLGWVPRRPAVIKGAAALRRLAPGKDGDVYFLHFATPLLREVGGDDWRAWQPAVRHWLLEHQERGERGTADRGSWSPQGQKYAAAGGRLLTTALALLMLQDCVRPGRPPAPPRRTLTDKELLMFREELGAENFVKARSAMRALAAAPRQSVPLLAALLEPPPEATRRRVARLITDLGAREFAVRDGADRELRKLGAAAEPALRRALKAASALDLRRRLERLLERLEESRLGPADVRALRAVQVLACAGTPEARRVLEEVARGEPEDRLTRSARAALLRTGGAPGGKAGPRP
jgi:hypothetical protein